MRIEFKTVYNEIVNERLAELYVKYFMEKQIKQYNRIMLIMVVIAVLAVIMGFLTENYPLIVSAPFYLIFGFYITRRSKKKLLPKAFMDVNVIGCPYNVTFGFYDDYFYEKFEGNMCINESSIRYEFLKKVVETPDCFVIMTKRSQLFYLPKSDMGYENVMMLSAFFKSRLPYVLQVVDK